MITRRDSIKLFGAVAASSILPLGSFATAVKPADPPFRYCLNTSTIRGQGQGLVESIEIAAKAGYDGVELWVTDVQAYVKQGKSLAELRKILESNSLVVEGAIAFAQWSLDDPEQRRNGMMQMEAEMKMMAQLGCKRFAAPPSGFSGAQMDFLKAGERFREAIALGRKTGVMPQLEFQGGSKVLHHLGQAMFVAVATNDPDARILADVYHLYKGGSGFNGLKMIDGSMLEIFHINDYPGNVPLPELKDSHRVYPGDGAAPMKEILTDLRLMGGTKVLSLELFNADYWKQDALEVAKTGLQKMKKVVQSSL